MHVGQSTGTLDTHWTLAQAMLHMALSGTLLCNHTHYTPGIRHVHRRSRVHTHTHTHTHTMCLAWASVRTWHMGAPVTPDPGSQSGMAPISSRSANRVSAEGFHVSSNVRQGLNIRLVFQLEAKEIHKYGESLAGGGLAKALKHGRRVRS
jgi:hypothetical protein